MAILLEIYLGKIPNSFPSIHDMYATNPLHKFPISRFQIKTIQLSV
jgi:hypothetical protein